MPVHFVPVSMPGEAENPKTLALGVPPGTIALASDTNGWKIDVKVPENMRIKPVEDSVDAPAVAAEGSAGTPRDPHTTNLFELFDKDLE